MRPIYIIALNTLRQTIRQRLFFNVAIFGVGMLILSMVLGQITFGYPDRVVRTIGLSGSVIALDLIGLLVGVTLIHQEIDRKTLFVVLTRPVGRGQYVLGRYLGLLMALALALSGFMLVFSATIVAVGGSVTWTDMIALGLAFPEAMLIGGIGIVLSSFSTPTLSAGIGLGAWIASATTDDLLRFSAKSEPFVQSLVKVVYYVLPSLERLNFREAAIYHSTVAVNDFALALLYGVVYAGVLVAIAIVILSRREMV